MVRCQQDVHHDVEFNQNQRCRSKSGDLLFSDGTIDRAQAVEYGSGYFAGDEYLDKVVIADGLEIDKQSIGVAESSQGFGTEGFDGILGVGPVDLTNGTLSIPDNNITVPTVTDNLAATKKMEGNVLGIQFAPPNSWFHPGGNGSLSFGAPDPTAYLFEVLYAPVTTTPPASMYVGVDAGFGYGNVTLFKNTTGGSTTAGIVDTGTSLVLLASNIYDKYVNVTGAQYDQTVGLLYVNETQFAKFDNFYVTVNGHSFPLIPDAQRLPASLNSQFNGAADRVYLVVGDPRLDQR